MPPETDGGENCPAKSPTTFPKAELVQVDAQRLRFVAIHAHERHLQKDLWRGGGLSTFNRFTTLPAVAAICTAREELIMSLVVPRR